MQSQPVQSPGPVEQVGNALSARGYVRRRGKEGRPKLRGLCLFHEDQAPSADFYLDDGWYYCHACSESWSVEEVAFAIGLDIKMGQPAASPSAQSSFSEDFHYSTRFGYPAATYTYRFPDGRVSHYKHRFQPPGQKKTFAIQAPDGDWQQPNPIWPIYGDYNLWPGLNIVVVEGEKAVQQVNQALHSHDGIMIVALTCGSAPNMGDFQNRKTLIGRLRELEPYRVLVWPDNDKPGQEWAGPLHRQLRSEGFTAALTDVRRLPVEQHEGCDDFIEVGGNLDDVFIAEFQQVGGYMAEQIVQNTIVTKNEQFLLPGTRRLYPVTIERMEMLLGQVNGDFAPNPKLVKRLRTELCLKSAGAGVDIYWRRWHDRSCTRFGWRGIESGFAYHVDAGGRTVIPDPPNALLLLPSGDPYYSPKVDEHGSRSDLEQLGRLFGLSPTDITFIEGWLLCALIGLETPILLLRGEAGSGKTTLARALVGLIEPNVPAMNLQSNRGMQIDQRALIEALRQSATVLFDNVSGLTGEAEDLLCQFVTGFSVMHRQLYENKVENLSMRRAIVITTTNWDVHKGDLSSRLVAVRMRPKLDYKSSGTVVELVESLIERIRGYLFKAAMTYYRNRDSNGTSTIRITGISEVFRALGYDSVLLEARLTSTRAAISSETDQWFQSIVEWYQSLELQPGQTADVKFEDIRAPIEGLMATTIWSPQKFAQYLNECAPRFRDLGFTIEKKRTAQRRFWVVTCLREMEEYDD